MSVVESISSCRQVDLQGGVIGIWGGDTRDRLNHQDERFWRFWGVWVLGTGYKPWIRWDIGVDGGDGGDSNGVGC